MKKVLIICYSPLHRDPRVLTQIDALKNNYKVICAGYTDPKIDGVEFHNLIMPKRNFVEKLAKPFLILLRQTNTVYWSEASIRNYNVLSDLNYVDVVISNELNILLLGLKLKDKYKSKLILDAHEYYPGIELGKGLKYLINKLYHHQVIAKYFKKADMITTIGEGIRDLYKKNFKIDSEVVMNLPAFINQEISENKGKIKIVHHGNAMPKRKLERMIEMMRYLKDNYSLTFYLMVHDKYQKYFKQLKQKANTINKEIYFNEAVPTNEIPYELNKYDIGLYILPPTSLNNKFALPNKLFEFIQARLAVAIGPSPEMKRIVQKYSVGIVSHKFTSKSMADEIMKIDRDDIKKFKENSNKTAKVLNSGELKKMWLNLVSDLL